MSVRLTFLFYSFGFRKKFSQGLVELATQKVFFFCTKQDGSFFPLLITQLSLLKLFLFEIEEKMNRF